MIIKKLLAVFLVCLAGMVVKGQKPTQVLGTKTGRIEIAGQSKLDSLAFLPKYVDSPSLDIYSDTLGAVFYRELDGYFYFRDSIPGGGHVWSAFGKYSDHPVTRYLGALYNKNNWTSLSDFTNVGATVNIIGGKLQFSNGDGNTMSQTLQLPAPSDLEHWSYTIKFTAGTKTSTSYGPGVGIQSVNTWNGVPAAGVFDMTNSATSGTVRLFVYAGTFTSQAKLSFSPGDLIQFTVGRDVDTLYGSAIDLTTNSASVSQKYIFPLISGFNNVLPNTGNYSIFSEGGTWTVDSIAVNSTEIQNPNLLVIGDSKVDYDVTSKFYRYADRLRYAYPSVVIDAGPADRLEEGILRIPEFIKIHPQRVLLCLGRNSINFGDDSNTVKSMYIRLTDSLWIHGIPVYHLLPQYETSIDQTWFVKWIMRTYPNFYIDDYTPTKECPNCLGDVVHLNNTGQQLVYSTIINSFVLPGGNRVDHWGLTDVLAYSSYGGDGPGLCTTCTGAFNDGTSLNLTSGLGYNEPFISFNPYDTTGFPGGSLVWRSRYSGSKLAQGIWGDSAIFGLTVHQDDNGGELMGWFIPDTLPNTGSFKIPLIVRGEHDPFFGNRYRPTVEAGYNLFAGVITLSDGNVNPFFTTTKSTFAVDAANFPIAVINLPGQTIDTTYNDLVSDATGNIYRLRNVQTTVNGSSSGSAVFNEPVRMAGYKKVIVYCGALNGTATYNFPVAFIHTPVVTFASAGITASSLSTTAVTASASTATGYLIIEGI